MMTGGGEVAVETRGVNEAIVTGTDLENDTGTETDVVMTSTEATDGGVKAGMATVTATIEEERGTN